MPGAAAVSSSSSAAGSSSNVPSPRPTNGPSTRMKAGGMHNGGGSTSGTASGSTNGMHLQGSYQTAPLSSRRAQPLDLNTVERRGTPTAVKESQKLIRPHGLQEAPTYRPTLEEWKEPLEYIQKIADEGRKYGIIKIIPPDSWNPDFAIDTEVRRYTRLIMTNRSYFTIVPFISFHLCLFQLHMLTSVAVSFPNP